MKPRATGSPAAAAGPAPSCRAALPPAPTEPLPPGWALAGTDERFVELARSRPCRAKGAFRKMSCSRAQRSS